jgi:hypothetical protein
VTSAALTGKPPAELAPAGELPAVSQVSYPIDTQTAITTRLPCWPLGRRHSSLLLRDDECVHGARLQPNPLDHLTLHVQEHEAADSVQCSALHHGNQPFCADNDAFSAHSRCGQPTEWHDGCGSVKNARAATPQVDDGHAAGLYAAFDREDERSPTSELHEMRILESTSPHSSLSALRGEPREHGRCPETREQP